MKKLFSLIRASMTSDMNLFKFHSKKNSKKTKILVTFFIAFGLMISIWVYANIFFEKLATLGLQHLGISLMVFVISLFTIIEGVYKSSSLLFNCKDDQLLLSLPIKRTMVVFVRIFKFYVFELLFNSLFIIPVIIAYIRWALILDWTFFLTSFVMLILLPVIPIVLSCFFGAIIASFSGKFKHKNIVQIIVSTILVLLIIYLSYNIDYFLEYLLQNVTSINELIMKIYYPAGVFAKLAVDFKAMDLIVFILINIALLVIGVLILSHSYFKINSKLKQVSTTSKKHRKHISIQSKSITGSLIKKELNTFFNTPVFVMNAGFGLVLFVIAALAIVFKFERVLPLLISEEGLNMPADLIMSKLPILVLILIIITSFMTSITSSVISLEGRNINILKSLPVSTKKLLMSKIYACLVITTPVILLGDIILFVYFKMNIIESLMLVILSILIPLVSHFIGLLINLKFPKLDAENSTEVVKQSISSFVAVMIGMLLLIVSIVIIIKIIKYFSSVIILGLAIIAFALIDIILYMCLIHIGTREFNALLI